MSHPKMDDFWRDDALLHDTGMGLWEHGPEALLDVPELHPENDERIRNMRSVLQRGPLAESIEWHQGRYAPKEELATVHDREYVESIRRQIEATPGRLDDDNTVISFAGRTRS